MTKQTTFWLGNIRSTSCSVVLLLATPVFAGALEAPPPELPPIGQPLRLPNPYRSLPAAAKIGEAAYARHCASCHGEGAVTPSAEGPELRRLNTFCNRLKDPSLKDRCLRDVDTYFMRSVLEGKIRAGSVHMPGWKDVLPQETIWAIRSFTETRPAPERRTLPDLPPATPEPARNGTSRSRGHGSTSSTKP